MILILCHCSADGPLASFINYGVGMLRPLANAPVYDRLVPNIDLETCAQMCLDEVQFDCQSFDFIFDFDSRPRDSASVLPGSQSAACQLSRHVAGGVAGLMIDSEHPRHNHFEKMGTVWSLVNS